MYLTSYAFKFCVYHRLPLHYTVVNELINIIDCYYHIPISNLEFLMLYLIIAGITLFLIVYFYVKAHKKVFRKDSI